MALNGITENRHVDLTAHRALTDRSEFLMRTFLDHRSAVG
jgi:hypothetical protein